MTTAAPRVEITLSDLLGPAPGATQLDFVLDPHREVCWIGGFGCGKTVGLAAKAVAHMIEWPGARAMLCRLTYDEMVATTKQTFYQVARPLFERGLVERPKAWDYRDTTNLVRLTNGSEVTFKNLEDPTRRYKNYELTFVGIDQAEENEFEVFEILNNRLRPMLETQHIPASARQMVVIANDNGYNWLYERFHPSENKDPVRRAFFHASSLDNPHLDQQYLTDLLNNPPEWVSRNVFAEMKRTQGRLLMDPRVLDSFTPPSGSVVFLGIDHGESSVCSAHWAWYNDTNRTVEPAIPPGWTVVFREYWCEGKSVDHHAKAILDCCRTLNVQTRVMDHTAFRLTQTKKGGFRRSIADVYADCGLFLTPSIGNPETRIERYNLVCSQGLIVTRACPNLLRQIPKYHSQMNRRTGNPEIVRRSTFHAIDSVGYVLMSTPRPTNPNLVGPDMLDGVPAHLQPNAPYWQSMKDEQSRQFALANWDEGQAATVETVPFVMDLNEGLVPWGDE